MGNNATFAKIPTAVAAPLFGTMRTKATYTGLLRKYQIDLSLRCPDIIFEFDAEKCDFNLLEIKRTQDERYIVDSAYKIIVYLKNVEKCFILGKMPHAILVV